MSKFLITLGMFLLTVILISGCDKERTVTSTEYVHDIEYVQLSPDTVFQVDTLINFDSVTIYEVDTVVQYDTTTMIVTDTMIQVNYVYDTTHVYDTVIQMSYIHDTMLVYDTVDQIVYVYDTIVQWNYVYDTIVTVQQHYDTVTIVDTIETIQCSPDEHFAFAALEYYSDPQVLEIINQEFGIADGWVLYLSQWQVDLSQASSGIYDIYGYIDYWTPDWSAYYPIEFYWRVSYLSGDPSDPHNWQLSEPPSATAGMEPGLNLHLNATEASSALR